jgi:hypothetical protein
MKRRKRVVIGGACAAVAAFAAIYVVGRARAAGVPTMPPVMTYSGTLTDPSGTALTGSKNIQIAFWDQATGGATPLCVTPSTMQMLVGGSFQIALPDTCVAAVHANPDVWVEVSVDGAPLTRTKIGAVPYALEAASAASAAGALDNRLATLMPPKSVITANLSASDVSTNFDGTGLGNAAGPYAGWAICNGNNGTPNLTAKFVRISATAAGATGGSDSIAHTHAIDHTHPAFTSGAEASHTHATPAHGHALPVGFDGGSVYFTSMGDGTPIYGSFVTTANRGTVLEQAASSQLTRQGTTDTSGAGTTGAGSAHSHTVSPPAFAGTSGAASVTDNRPAYYELVALMRM